MSATPPRRIFSFEHDQFRETAKAFFRKEVEPNVKEWEKVGIFDAGLFPKAAQYGLLQAGIPTEYGGMGGDFLHHAILFEEHGYSPAGASMGGGLCIDGSSYLIWAGGTESQKKEWLPRYASGETIAEAAFSEPQSGSDVGGFRTFARKDGDDYIVNGSKIWCTNGSMLTMLPTVVRMDMPNGSTGLSILLIDRTARDLRPATGSRRCIAAAPTKPKSFLRMSASRKNGCSAAGPAAVSSRPCRCSTICASPMQRVSSRRPNSASI